MLLRSGCSPLASEHKEQLWMDLKAGAESGWDFTSRWYINGSGTLRETRTSQILPSDLNALLCRNERTLASFHRLLGERTGNLPPWRRPSFSSRLLLRNDDVPLPDR